MACKQHVSQQNMRITEKYNFLWRVNSKNGAINVLHLRCCFQNVMPSNKNVSKHHRHTREKQNVFAQNVRKQ